MFKQGALTDEEMLELQGNGDNLASFQSYDDYLDSQITPEDLYYLEDEELARQLVELGYRGSGETLKRDEFESRKKAEREKNSHKVSESKRLASANCDLTQYTFLQALANREELVRYVLKFFFLFFEIVFWFPMRTVCLVVNLTYVSSLVIFSC